MRIRFSTTLVIVIAVVLALALVGCGTKDKNSSGMSLDNKTTEKAEGTVAEGSGTSGGSSASAGGSAASGQKASDGAGSAQGSSGSTGGSGSTSGKTGTSGGSGSGGSGVSSSASKGLTIKIMWWNDTVNRAPKNAEIVFAGRSYKPAAGKSDQGSIGPCPIGKQLELVVYPDGRGTAAHPGTKLIAKFTVNAQMVANSETDAIHVELKDTGLRVLGNPVNNFVQSFSRP